MFSYESGGEAGLEKWKNVQRPTYLSDGGGQQIDDSVVRHGNDALSVDFDDTVTDSHSATLGDAAAKEAANLVNKGRKERIKNKVEGNQEKTTTPTTPFCTLNPSWYFVSGRLIFTPTTGAQGTMVNLTAV